jgi:hypothetical protein
MIAALVGLLLAGLGLTSVSAANDTEPGTRVFEGRGSVGIDSEFEIYLVEGTYQHEIGGGCVAAASLFPADREPAVRLGDVLQADLGTESGRPNEGVVEISVAGWANLQIGTGPDCSWSYAITGAFYPEGDEPAPPRAPDELVSTWGPIAAALVVLGAALVLAARSSRRSSGESDDEPEVKVAPLEGPVGRDDQVSSDGAG